MPPTDPESPLLSKVEWHPNGSCFAVPGKDKGTSAFMKLDYRILYLRRLMRVEWFMQCSFGLSLKPP